MEDFKICQIKTAPHENCTSCQRVINFRQSSKSALKCGVFCVSITCLLVVFANISENEKVKHANGERYKYPSPIRDNAIDIYEPKRAEVVLKSTNKQSDHGRFGIDSCRKTESVFFLKTSKTGSTTLANILVRFGYARNKTFLLGEQSNGALWFINSYLPFNEEVCFLGRDIPNRPRIDIRLE